jgi:asparaginyl-tRNA synthetase
LYTDVVYVDESTGTDKADGSSDKPFPTILSAFIARDSDAINVQVKTAPKEGEGAAIYQEMTASAKKKASKLFAQHKNKVAKQEELRKREEAEGEAKRIAEAKKLEEAKAIVLEEPSTPAQKIKIRQAVEQRGKRVRVSGWVHRLRQQGGMTFVILRDGTGYLQCVLTGRLVRSLSLAFAHYGSTSSPSDDYNILTVPNLRRSHPHSRIDRSNHGRD